MQQAIACKCEAGFCSVRNRELPKSMMTQCAAGHGDAVSAMLEVIDAGREKRRLAAAAAFQNGKTIRVRRHAPKPREPVGTAMEGNISRILKLKTGKGCGCSTLVTKMNAWGIRGCEANRVEIVDTLMQHREKMQISFAASAFAMAKEIGIVDSLKLGAKLVGDLIEMKDVSREAEIAGCNWLLDKSIEDVGRSRPRKVARKSHRSGRRESRLPLIGIPIDREKLQSHIMYHIMPLSGDTEWVWRRHCDWLREVRHQFNGRLIVGIVTPGEQDAWSYCPQDAVVEALSGLDAEFIIAPNDTGNRKNRKHARQGKGEGVLFPQMLGKLQTSDPNQVAFYGHCKGVTRPQTPLGSPIHLWAEAMFETVFRNHNAAVNALDTHGICGSFRMPGGYRDGGPGIGSNPFFSGTFFAMRLVDVFVRNWQYLPTHYGCVEQWPRLNFEMQTQAACLFFDNVTNLYDDAYWRSEVTPAFEQWKQARGVTE